MDFRHLAEVFIWHHEFKEWLDDDVAVYRLPDFEIHVTWDCGEPFGARIVDFKIYEVGDNEE